MAIKKYKPTTPGQRFKEISAFDELTPDVKPEKSLLKPQKRSGGRNNTGKMTMRYMGGGHKKRYRLIDFKRNKDNIEATVKSIEYDPNRSAWIALVVYTDGEKRYIIAPEGSDYLWCFCALHGTFLHFNPLPHNIPTIPSLN